jgi:hypothetical protein
MTHAIQDDEMSPEESDKICAERWRALMAMPHLSHVGSAGYNEKFRKEHDGHEDYRHLTFNLWTMFDTDRSKYDQETCDRIDWMERETRRMIIEAVDIFRRLEPEKVQSHADYNFGWRRLTNALRERQRLHLGDSKMYHLCQYLASRYGLDEPMVPMIENIPTIRDEWDDHEYRHAYVEAAIEQGLSHQVRFNRNIKGWTRQQLADATDVPVEVIDAVEDEQLHYFTGEKDHIEALLAIGKAFDIALSVTYVSFDELREAADHLSLGDVTIPSYGEEKAVRELSKPPVQS